MTPTARVSSSAAGFTFIELLVASAMFVAMAGAMIELARGARMASTAIGDAADVQQKMRVAADAIQHDCPSRARAARCQRAEAHLRGFCRPSGRPRASPATPTSRTRRTA